MSKLVISKAQGTRIQGIRKPPSAADIMYSITCSCHLYCCVFDL